MRNAPSSPKRTEIQRAALQQGTLSRPSANPTQAFKRIQGLAEPTTLPAKPVHRENKLNQPSTDMPSVVMTRYPSESFSQEGISQLRKLEEFGKYSPLAPLYNTPNTLFYLSAWRSARNKGMDPFSNPITTNSCVYPLSAWRLSCGSKST